VLEIANEKNELLLTADKDFGELVFRQRRVQRSCADPIGRAFSHPESRDSGFCHKEARNRT